jgi:hypothetical protein
LLPAGAFRARRPARGAWAAQGARAAPGPTADMLGTSKSPPNTCARRQPLDRPDRTRFDISLIGLVIATKSRRSARRRRTDSNWRRALFAPADGRAPRRAGLVPSVVTSQGRPHGRARAHLAPSSNYVKRPTARAERARRREWHSRGPLLSAPIGRIDANRCAARTPPGKQQPASSRGRLGRALAA